MRALLFPVLMALAFPFTSASAGTLRCGSYLIQDGDDAFSVYDRGSGSFPAIITIVDGFVQSIRFVR